MIGLDIHKEEDKRNGMLMSILVHLLLLLICIWPFVSPDPETPEVKTVYVAFSEMTDDQEAVAVQASSAPEQEEAEEEPLSEAEPEASPMPTTTTRPEPPTPTKQESVIKEPTPTQEESPVYVENKVDPPVISIPIVEEEEKESAEDLARAKAERERQEREARERRAEEERRKKEAQLKEQKSQFGSLFSGSSEDSESENEEEGQEIGSDIGSYIQPSNKISGGLGNRKVVYEPSIRDNSQKTGRVVMSICVNQAGIVEHASYTQKGSTTTDSKLIRKAKEAAERYKFNTSDITKQCGTVAFDFTIQ